METRAPYVTHRPFRARRHRRGLRFRLLAEQHRRTEQADRLSRPLREHRVGTAAGRGRSVQRHPCRRGHRSSAQPGQSATGAGHDRGCDQTRRCAPTPMSGLEFQGLDRRARRSRSRAAATRRRPGHGRRPRRSHRRSLAGSEHDAGRARRAAPRRHASLAENSEPLRETIANLKTFSAALARNSDRLDAIVAGVERMTGGGPAAAPPVVYDLIAPRAFPPTRQGSRRAARRCWSRLQSSCSTRRRFLVRPSGSRGSDICQRAMERQSAEAAARADHPEFRECEPAACGSPAKRRPYRRSSAPDRYSQVPALDGRRAAGGCRVRRQDPVQRRQDHRGADIPRNRAGRAGGCGRDRRRTQRSLRQSRRRAGGLDNVGAMSTPSH